MGSEIIFKWATTALSSLQTLRSFAKHRGNQGTDDEEMQRHKRRLDA
jgi:hypothetical protein